MEAAMMCIHLPGVSRFCLEKCCFSPPVLKFIIKLLKFSFFFKNIFVRHTLISSQRAICMAFTLCKSLSLSHTHTHIFFLIESAIYVPWDVHIRISGPKAKPGNCLPLGPSDHRHSDLEGQS